MDHHLSEIIGGTELGDFLYLADALAGDFHVFLLLLLMDIEEGEPDGGKDQERASQDDEDNLAGFDEVLDFLVGDDVGGVHFSKVMVAESNPF